MTINPLIKIVRFKRKDKNATAVNYGPAYVYGPDNLEQLFEGLVELGRCSGEPRLWSACWWDGSHTKQSFKSACGVFLEWHVDSAADAIEGLLELGWCHYLIDGENDAHNTVIAFIPFTHEVTSAKVRNRVASILACEVGAYLLSEGVESRTFFVQAQPYAKVIWNDGPLLNADELYEKNADEWVEVKHYQGPKPSVALARC